MEVIGDDTHLMTVRVPIADLVHGIRKYIRHLTNFSWAFGPLIPVTRECNATPHCAHVLKVPGSSIFVLNRASSANTIAYAIFINTRWKISSHRQFYSNLSSNGRNSNTLHVVPFCSHTPRSHDHQWALHAPEHHSPIFIPN